MPKYIDYLTEDDTLSNQKWTCISFLSPEGVKNCTIRGLKIRGVYNTKEEADKRAKQLQEIDPDFNVFVGEVGKWLPWDPDPHSVEEQVYGDEKLNDLMKKYKENLEQAKVTEEKRKRDAVDQARIHNESLKEKNKKTKEKDDRKATKLQKKLKTTDKTPIVDVENTSVSSEDNEDNEDTENVENVENVENDEKGYAEKIVLDEKNINEEKEEINTLKEEINNNAVDLSSVENNLKKIKELYNTIHQKDK
jgi:hypothetical protein